MICSEMKGDEYCGMKNRSVSTLMDIKGVEGVFAKIQCEDDDDEIDQCRMELLDQCLSTKEGIRKSASLTCITSYDGK